MISSILLAAGLSKRMNGDNKLIKEIDGTPLIERAVRNILESSVDEIIIVVGYQKEIIKRLLDKNDKIKFALNKDYESGVASSIKTGLKHLSQKTDAFIICLADMPNINKDIYNQLIRSKDKNKIIVPIYKEQQGNPILFSISLKNEIMKVKGDFGAKKIIEMNKDKVFNLKIEDQALTQNFNTQNSFN